MFTQGGRITFEPGSAQLSDLAKQQLTTLAGLIRGYKNKIELRGHTAKMEPLEGTGYQDLWVLSFFRAKAVMNFFTSSEIGIEPDRIRLIANADREPLAKRVYTPAAQEPNRRVEVLVMEALVEDFTRPEAPQ